MELVLLFYTSQTRNLQLEYAIKIYLIALFITNACDTTHSLQQNEEDRFLYSNRVFAAYCLMS
jgi:hypothetical protein